MLGDTKGKSEPLPEDTDDITDKIFKKAQEQGAQTAEQFQEQKKQAFTGSGQRLGSVQSDQPQQTQQPQRQQQQQPQQEKETKTVSITFYKEGFTIDDGELRRYEEPRNKEFLKAIDDGYVPREVSGMAHEVMVNLINKKGESYVPPPKTFKAFEGGGRSLGSSTTTTTTVAPSVKQTSNFAYKCDESKPFTTLQIRLYDGTTLKAKFNLSDTVSLLHQFVQHAKPVNQAFTLGTAFPKKVLTDTSLTLEQAGLKNAQVIQTLV